MLIQMRGMRTAFLSAIALAVTSNAEARILQPGESLSAGEVMFSENGGYLATMQHDGNFVVYSNDGRLRPIWSTDTTGRGAVIATMQRDGNFVLYDAMRRAIWWTGSNGRDRTFAISEFGEAMVVAPGRVKPGTHGPTSEIWWRLGVKPVWRAKHYDYVPARSNKGPYCIGDPHACARKLHGGLYQGP